MTIEEEGITGLPMDVDHVVPGSWGGADALRNYIASCFRCNRSRKNKPLRSRFLKERIDLRRRWIELEDFPEHASRVAAIDTAFTDIAYRAALRCVHHQWHLYGSYPAQLCKEQCLAVVSGISKETFGGYWLGTEWWSRYGDQSAFVLTELFAAAKRQGIDLRNHRGLRLDLPRRTRSAAEAIGMISLFGVPLDKDELEPAPPYSLDASFNLNPTNQRKATRASYRRSLEEEKRFMEEDPDSAFEWDTLLMLCFEKHWGTQSLYCHREAVLKAARSGRRKHIKELRKLPSHAHLMLEDYLKGILDRDQP